MEYVFIKFASSHPPLSPVFCAVIKSEVLFFEENVKGEKKKKKTTPEMDPRDGREAARLGGLEEILTNLSVLTYLDPDSIRFLRS